jgi:cytochrome c2
MRRYGVLSLALVFTLTMIVGGFLINASLATPQKGEQTAFEKKCSVCHTLERVKTEIEIMIKEMHDKAGIEISDAELKEIEESFTLQPVTEPHRAMFQEKCQKCHRLDMVIKAHQTKDEAQMKMTIERMSKKKGSEISKKDIDKIHESMFMLNEIYEKDVE